MKEKRRRIQLHRLHEQTAELTVFAGFEMPLQYKGMTPEHLAVRNNVGIFDISHMGRSIITGPDSERFLNHVITNDVSVLSPLSAQYSVMCNKKGGIIDDFVVYCLENEKFMMVSNASNREGDYNWLVRNGEGFDVKIEDVSDNVAMFAVQGPNAERTLQKISTADLSETERFKCAHLRLADTEVTISRTGYTGEDGFEIFVWDSSLERPDNAVELWKKILEVGKTSGLESCGLGARDTLRLEAGLCLYGNDIDDTTTPLEARLGFVVKFKKESFIGKDVLLKQKSEGIKRKRVGILMEERRIPRPGVGIYDDQGKEIGHVTSGTFSPLLRCGIGMAYVSTSHAVKGSTVNVKIRDTMAEGRIVSFPLYDTEKYGYKRKSAR